MADLCETCHARGEYLRFTQRALAYDSELRAQFANEKLPRNRRLFLGRHYAHSKTILFTLNPTPSDRPEQSRHIDTGLFKSGLHWDGDLHTKHRNWCGGRHLFRGVVANAPWFRGELELATDAFIAPWPSRDWKAMLGSSAWPAVKRASRSLFAQAIVDHSPALVFTTGKYASDRFWEFLGTPRPKPIKALKSPTARHLDTEMYVVELNGPMTVFRLPHFSRFSRAQFSAIGAWVAQLLPKHGP